MFNLNSKQTFVVVLVILLGIFLMPVIMAITGYNFNGKPIKPEIIYVHDTVIKYDTIVRVDTVVKYDTIHIHNQK